ncbi:hypothetical protein HK100_002888 [Physocladia obscura]|uniref:Uncharacterized protein n=1 Tax=Physocladia obscura TaxID=109957 RepID=A0AAD5XJX1_9FUNG|nr:hypothetical protein HK100_002888 [Physocladia obscura]
MSSLLKLTLLFATLGTKVVVNYAGNKAAAEEVVSSIKVLGSEAIAVQADVSNEQDSSTSRNSMFSSTMQVYSSVHQLRPRLPNIPYIQEHGTIINITSIVTKGPFPGVSNTLSKAVIEGFTRTLAVELGPRKIRVNTISPGHIDSDMLRSAGDGVAAAGAETSLFKRLGTPEDIAESAAFLAVPRSGACVTGANLLSHGGAGGFSIYGMKLIFSRILLHKVNT